ncbi:MAG TPA: methyltransferase domain-containing protein [Rhodothermales bacterium]
MQDSHYLHGTHPEEQARLTTLNQLLNERSLAQMVPRPGERILDMGSGLGQFTRMMARTAGRGRVLGIERSEEQIAEALRQARADGEEDLVEFRRGNVYDPPLDDSEWGTFDLAHARFVLEHVPEPLRVVQTMVRAVRAGGRIVLEDDDHDLLRLYPDCPGFAELWTAYTRSFDRLGNDPFVGRRLVSLLHRAGARHTRTTMLHFGGSAAHPHWPGLTHNIAYIIDQARPVILQHDLLEEEALDAGLDSFRSWTQRPDATVWYATMWAEGVLLPQS